MIGINQLVLIYSLLIIDFMDSISPTTNQKELRKIQTIHGERSFVLCLPKDFVSELNIAKGDYVRCSISNNQLIIEKADV
jgi:hypothetical protein